MPVERTDTLVVGGGQAGLAMSEHLNSLGIPHLVLERGRIAERWRSERWDSLVANGPAWHDRFPGMEFEGLDPDAFAPKEAVADYFVAYAGKIGAPVRCGVEVEAVEKIEGARGFSVSTSQGDIEADYVVAATGPFQVPVIPPVVPADAGVLQLHSAAYRNPDQLPGGAVLVVGAGCRRAGVYTSRSARTTARRAAIADATSSGGSACSASGMRRRRARVPNTLRSRSAAPTAATRSIFAGSRPLA